MKNVLLIIFLVIVFVSGIFTTQQTVFAQALGGKILFYDANPLSLFVGRHTIGPPTPSVVPVLCPICLQFAGIGRWFLGFAVGGVVTIGGLGGF